MRGVKADTYSVNFHGDKKGAKASKFITDFKAIGSSAESHLHDDKASYYANPIVKELKARIDRLEKDFFLIAHFKLLGAHTPSFKNRRTLYQVCRTRSLDNKTLQKRATEKNAAALASRLIQLKTAYSALMRS